MLDLTDAEDAAVMAAAKRLTQALVDAFSPDGVLVYQNNGLGSGQEVPHFHLHVVPRQPGSDWGFGPPHLERLEKEGRLRHEDHLVVTDEKRKNGREHSRTPVRIDRNMNFVAEIREAWGWTGIDAEDEL